MNKRKEGSKWEKIAGDFLRRQNINVLEYNFRCHLGEIDIVADDGKSLIFVEVKYRSSEQYGMAKEAVDVRKQRTISKVSDYYRIYHKVDINMPIRYDVIAIQGNKLEWIPGAFFR